MDQLVKRRRVKGCLGSGITTQNIWQITLTRHPIFQIYKLVLINIEVFAQRIQEVEVVLLFGCNFSSLV
jgi:hypothetical protein